MDIDEMHTVRNVYTGAEVIDVDFSKDGTWLVRRWHSENLKDSVGPDARVCEEPEVPIPPNRRLSRLRPTYSDLFNSLGIQARHQLCWTDQRGGSVVTPVVLDKWVNILLGELFVRVM